MIDSVGDKGAKLSSQQAKGKLKKLNDEYRALCTAAQVSKSFLKQTFGKLKGLNNNTKNFVLLFG